MSKKDKKIIFEWNASGQISRREADKQIKEYAKKIPRLVLIIAVIFLLTYLAVRDLPLPPNQSNWEGLFVKLFCVSVIFIILPLSIPYLERFSKIRYVIREKGIAFDNNFYHWDKMRGYRLEQDTDFPDTNVLVLYFQSHKKVAYLPLDSTADEIVAYVAKKVSHIDSESAENGAVSIKITKRDIAILCIITSVFIIAITYAFVSAPGKQISFFALLILILGPGTCGCFALYGKQLLKNPRLKLIAIAINMLAFALIMLLTVVILLRHFGEQVNETG